MSKTASILNKTFVYLNYITNGNSCVYVELDAPLEKDVLQRSVDLLIRRHPLLNSCLAKSIYGYRWVSKGDADGDILICQEIETNDRREIVEQLKRNAWERKFNVFEERQLRVYYLKTFDGAYVQLVPNHILADARASDLLMSNLAYVYNSLKENIPEEDILPDVPEGYSSNSLTLFASQLPVAKIIGLFVGALANIVIDLFRREHGIFVKKNASGEVMGKTSVAIKDIDSGLVELVKNRVKNNGYTMHPILVLSVLRSIQRYNDRRGKRSKVIRVSDMFSLLPFAKQDLTNVYDCFVVPFTSYYKMHDDDIKMMENIKEEILQHKKGGVLRELCRQGIYTFVGNYAPKKLATMLVTRFVVKNNIVISNPGVVKFNIEQFGNSRVISYTSFSQLFQPARIYFLFSTFREKLRLNILYDAGAFDDDEVENEIYSDFVLQLKQIANNLA